MKLGRVMLTENR